MVHFSWYWSLNDFFFHVLSNYGRTDSARKSENDFYDTRTSSGHGIMQICHRSRVARYNQLQYVPRKFSSTTCLANFKSYVKYISSNHEHSCQSNKPVISHIICSVLQMHESTRISVPKRIKGLNFGSTDFYSPNPTLH